MQLFHKLLNRQYFSRFLASKSKCTLSNKTYLNKFYQISVTWKQGWFLKKMTGFCEKEEYCALKTSLVSQRLPSLFMFSSLWDILWWLRGTILTADFLWGDLIGQCQEGCPDDQIRGKKLFSESKPGAEWAKLWVKSIQTQTLFEFVEKLVNLDENVVWSFLTLIAKNKLDEKGTLSLISNGVSFLMNTRIGLILVLEGIVFHYIWLKYLFATVTIDSDILF